MGLCPESIGEYGRDICIHLGRKLSFDMELGSDHSILRQFTARQHQVVQLFKRLSDGKSVKLNPDQ